MVDWYRGDPHADIESAKGLTFEEFGAYCVVLALLRLRAGAIPDDDRFIAGWYRCDVRIWRRLRERLIAHERLYVSDGMLRSPAADDDVAAAARRHAAAQAAGRASVLSRRAEASDSNDVDPTPALAAAPEPPLIERARAQAHAEIAAHIQGLGPYDMQDLVAGLLQAMGYVTTVAPPGPDGGTDILARKDPLGVATPQLRVQVKQCAARVGREDVAALRGVLDPAREVGLFVATAGFTRDARHEAAHCGAPVTLLGFDEFLELWTRHQDDAPEAARAHLRLAPVHFLAAEARRVGTRDPIPRLPPDADMPWPGTGSAAGVEMM